MKPGNGAQGYTPSHGSRRQSIRTWLTRRLSRPLEHGALERGERLPMDRPFKRLLVVRPNHRLGNLLLTTPMVSELESRFPGAAIDVLVRGGQGDLVFGDQPGVERILSLPHHPLRHPRTTWRIVRALRRRRYDLAVNVDSLSTGGRIFTRLCRARTRLSGLPSKSGPGDDPGPGHMAAAPVLVLREHDPRGETADRRPIPPLRLVLHERELARGSAALRDLAAGPGPVLCFYTHASGPKQYEAAWWEALRKALREGLPDWRQVEALPLENVSAFSFRLPAYYGPNIRELAAFLAHCDLVVSGDCGVMHLASAVGTPTVGLFQASARDKYAPYNQGSLGIDTRGHSPVDIARKILQAGRRLESAAGASDKFNRPPARRSPARR